MQVAEGVSKSPVIMLIYYDFAKKTLYVDPVHLTAPHSSCRSFINDVGACGPNPMSSVFYACNEKAMRMAPLFQLSYSQLAASLIALMVFKLGKITGSQVPRPSATRVSRRFSSCAPTLLNPFSHSFLILVLDEPKYNRVLVVVVRNPA